MTTLTQERVRHFLDYHPETGEFFYKNRFHQKLNGKPVKGTLLGGYFAISIDGKIRVAHRLAWLYMTGCTPTETIDHKDVNKLNNRWDNLRLASRSQNKANCRKRVDSTSPYKGVYWGARQRKWGAHISCQGKRYHLGYFFKAEDASAAYMAAATKLFGEFARVA